MLTRVKDLFKKKKKSDPSKLVGFDRINTGNQGCYYKPSIPCSPEDVENGITKITTTDLLENEKEIYRKLDEIDPVYNYHLKYNSCPITTSAKKVITTDSTKCTLEDEELNQMLTISSNGITLVDFTKKIKIYRDRTHHARNYNHVLEFWYYSYNLILFLAELRLNELYHNSLNPYSILIDYSDNVPRKNILKVIDFGVSASTPVLYDIEVKDTTSTEITDRYKITNVNKGSYVHPPEMSMCSIYKKSSENYDNENVGYNYYRLSVLDKIAYKDFLKFTSSGYTFSKHQYEEGLVLSVHESLGKYTDMWDKYKKTIDIFGMGCVFNFMLSKTGEYIKYYEDEQYYVDRIFLSNAKKLFYKMVHPLFTKRIDIITLLTEYKSLFLNIYLICVRDYTDIVGENDLFTINRLFYNITDRLLENELYHSGLIVEHSKLITMSDMIKYDTLETYNFLFITDIEDDVSYKTLFNNKYQPPREYEVVYLIRILKRITDKNKYGILYRFLILLLQRSPSRVDNITEIKRQLTELMSTEKGCIETEKQKRPGLYNSKQLHDTLIDVQTKVPLVEGMTMNDIISQTKESITDDILGNNQIDSFITSIKGYLKKIVEKHKGDTTKYNSLNLKLRNINNFLDKFLNPTQNTIHRQSTAIIKYELFRITRLLEEIIEEDPQHDISPEIPDATKTPEIQSNESDGSDIKISLHEPPDTEEDSTHVTSTTGGYKPKLKTKKRRYRPIFLRTPCGRSPEYKRNPTSWPSSTHSNFSIKPSRISRKSGKKTRGRNIKKPKERINTTFRVGHAYPKVRFSRSLGFSMREFV